MSLLIKGKKFAPRSKDLSFDEIKCINHTSFCSVFFRRMEYQTELSTKKHLLSTLNRHQCMLQFLLSWGLQWEQYLATCEIS